MAVRFCFGWLGTSDETGALLRICRETSDTAVVLFEVLGSYVVRGGARRGRAGSGVGVATSTEGAGQDWSRVRVSGGGWHRLSNPDKRVSGGGFEPVSDHLLRGANLRGFCLVASSKRNFYSHANKEAKLRL